MRRQEKGIGQGKFTVSFIGICRTLPDCLRPTVQQQQRQQQHGASNGIRFSAISYAKKEVLANGNNLLTTQGKGKVGLRWQHVAVWQGQAGYKHVIKALLAILTLQSSVTRAIRDY